MLGSCLVGMVALLLISPALQTTEGAKILALVNLASRSHHIFNRVITRTLASRGHQVTVISPDIDKDNVPNLTTIHLEGIYDAARENFDCEAFIEKSVLEMTFTMFDWVTVTCEAELKSAGGQKLLDYPSTERFDLIITEAGWTECFYGFIPKFGSPPVVAITAFGIPPWTSSIMGSSLNPSYMPNFALPYESHMTFSQRLFNFIVHNLMMFVHHYSHIPTQEAIARKYFKEELPSFLDIERNFSLLLANVAFGLEDARPLSPNIIPVGGMHIKMNPDPLPKDLKKFLDEATDGFIYFSLGSNLRSDEITKVKQQALLEAFSELRQRVLWKFETDNLPDLPSNVKISKWLPQNDILAHPNIRMFISHCGLLSITEAIYRGVPIVGIPFFMDQIINLQKFITKGIGVKLDFLTLTKESVLTAVNEVLNNNSYSNNMKKQSAVFRDQPETGIERAMFWIEYVIRHNGAPHLRPASVDLYWHQYLLLDVLLVLVSCVLLVGLAMFLVFRTIYRTLSGKQSKKTKKN